MNIFLIARHVSKIERPNVNESICRAKGCSVYKRLWNPWSLSRKSSNVSPVINGGQVCDAKVSRTDALIGVSILACNDDAHRSDAW